MIGRHPLAFIGTAILSSGATFAASTAHLIVTAADHSGVDVTGLVTSGGTLSLTGILALFGLKFSRGEIVFRDVAASELALRTTADERRDERAQLAQALEASNGNTREVVDLVGQLREVLTVARAELATAQARNERHGGPS